MLIIESFLESVILTKAIDLIDVELFSSHVNEIVETAKANDIYVVMSNHDFEKTPAKEEIIWRLRKMQELGAHIPKIAVMPKNPNGCTLFTRCDVYDEITLCRSTNHYDVDGFYWRY